MIDTAKLEKKIASAIGNGNIGSADLMELIDEVATAADQAEQLAVAEKAKALDLIASPDAGKAHDAVVAAELTRDRLKTILPKLRERLTDALAAEQHARWVADYQRIEAARDAAANNFSKYPELIAQLVDILREAEAVDKEVSRINIAAPEGEHRRLLGVELTARGLTAHSRTQPEIAKNISLPEWACSDRMAWPPQRPSIAAAYAASIAPGFDPRYSADWWKVSEEAAAARQREQERTAKHFKELTMQQEQRLNREEKERFESGQRRT